MWYFLDLSIYLVKPSAQRADRVDFRGERDRVELERHAAHVHYDLLLLEALVASVLLYQRELLFDTRTSVVNGLKSRQLFVQLWYVNVCLELCCQFTHLTIYDTVSPQSSEAGWEGAEACLCAVQACPEGGEAREPGPAVRDPQRAQLGLQDPRCLGEEGPPASEDRPGDGSESYLRASQRFDGALQPPQGLLHPGHLLLRSEGPHGRSRPRALPLASRRPPRQRG